MVSRIRILIVSVILIFAIILTTASCADISASDDQGKAGEAEVGDAIDASKITYYYFDNDLRDYVQVEGLNEFYSRLEDPDTRGVECVLFVEYKGEQANYKSTVFDEIVIKFPGEYDLDPHAVDGEYICTSALTANKGKDGVLFFFDFANYTIFYENYFGVIKQMTNDDRVHYIKIQPLLTPAEEPED